VCEKREIPLDVHRVCAIDGRLPRSPHRFMARFDAPPARATSRFAPRPQQGSHPRPCAASYVSTGKCEDRPGPTSSPALLGGALHGKVVMPIGKSCFVQHVARDRPAGPCLPYFSRVIDAHPCCRLSSDARSSLVWSRERNIKSIADQSGRPSGSFRSPS